MARIRLLPMGQEFMRRMLVRQGVGSVFTEVDGHRMHFFDVPGKGSGPTVVLLHGLGGSAIGWGRCLLPLARHARRILVPDLPGSGWSPDPVPRALSLLELGAVCERFIEQEARGPVALVGNSLGGAMAARTAATRPDLVNATVLIAPAGAKVADERFRALIDSFRVQSVDDARALSKRLFNRPPVLMPLLLGSDLYEMFSRESVAAVLADTVNHTSLTEEELRALSMPLLLLWGKGERLLPYESIEYFRAHLPGHAVIEEVDGFGHCPQVESPRKLVARLSAFLARHGAVAA